MVPPTMNRVRGKSKESRHREKRHREKLNAKQAGKTPVVLVKDRGKGAAGVGKKKQKKKEQKARLLQQAKSGAAKMEY